MSEWSFSVSSSWVIGGMIAVGVASLLYAILAWAHRVEAARRAAAGWSVTDGEILSRRIIHERYNDSPDDHIPEIRYAYRVAGRRFEGDRFRIGARAKFEDKALADAAVAPYPPGARVRVHYDPQRPENAVLETVPSGAGLKQWVIMGIFLLASSAFIIYGYIA